MGSDPSGLVRVEAAVIVSGNAARVLLDALAIAARHRRMSGMSTDPYLAIAQALADVVATDGQTVRQTPPVVQSLALRPMLTVAEAAEQLNLSRRTVRRLAGQLGGQRVGRSWLLDPIAVAQHLEGRAQWTA